VKCDVMGGNKQKATHDAASHAKGLRHDHQNAPFSSDPDQFRLVRPRKILFRERGRISNSGAGTVPKQNSESQYHRKNEKAGGHSRSQE
jgi:hypothetical protein